MPRDHDWRRRAYAGRHLLRRAGGDGDVRFRPAAARRIGQAAHRVQRRAERPAEGVLPQPVCRRRRRRAPSGHDAVRGDRRPPGLPVLGRAGAEGEVPPLPGRPLGPRGRLEHAPRIGVGPAGRVAARHLRRHAGDVDLPAGVRRRRPQVDRTAGALRHPGPRLGDSREGASGPVRARPQRQAARLLQRLLRRPVPAGEARPHSHPGLRRGGHGELGSDHVPRERLCSSTPSRALR